MDALLKNDGGIIIDSLYDNDDDSFSSINEEEELKTLGYTEFIFLCAYIHNYYKITKNWVCQVVPF